MSVLFQTGLEPAILCAQDAECVLSIGGPDSAPLPVPVPAAQFVLHTNKPFTDQSIVNLSDGYFH